MALILRVISVAQYLTAVMLVLEIIFNQKWNVIVNC